MDWDELLTTAKLGDNIKITLINPLRKGEHFKEGELCGFKAGIWGGGWHNQNRSFSSRSMRRIKKPKVYIAYNLFQLGKKQYMDWVDVDNCEFEIIENNGSE